jgi:hypothetical protein
VQKLAHVPHSLSGELTQAYLANGILDELSTPAQWQLLQGQLTAALAQV